MVLTTCFSAVPVSRQQEGLRKTPQDVEVLSETDKSLVEPHLKKM